MTLPSYSPTLQNLAYYVQQNSIPLCITTWKSTNDWVNNALVLAFESQCRGSNISPVVKWERTKPVCNWSQWSELPSILWHCWLNAEKGIRPVNTLCHLSHKFHKRTFGDEVFLFWDKLRNKPEASQLTQLRHEKQTWKQRWWLLNKVT